MLIDNWTTPPGNLNPPGRPEHIDQDHSMDEPTTWLLAAPIRIRWTRSRFKLRAGHASSDESEAGKMVGRITPSRRSWR
jgi:hypothetical protein